ncbi:Aste57867_11087 [Aphanomyces stellatus]|uniref:Aste57867_11087 protein n=1 Tax=Aphanomyces stellatus TaxID=120398 RepID=A0A485KS14_9STRA|nr:hypothetical protein As57867_011045 [Aphanomyces stellatus]VFT87954.1 Aste57867_11087 [Aphanomyces stellatus]
MDLNSTWRSAECVTSLYDRVRELELRNAELEAEVMQWRAEQSRQPAARAAAMDVAAHVELAKAVRERDEWRDRFKQQEDISRRLQKTIDTMTEDHRDVVARLKDRCVFDPHEPKRAQLCVSSLQKTLEGRAAEFDAMQQRVRDTLAMNAALIQSNAAMAEERAELQDVVARMSAVRLRALWTARWKANIGAAWKTWVVRAIFAGERQKREESFQRMASLVKQSKKQLLAHQAARFAAQRAKVMQTRVVQGWAAHAGHMQERRALATEKTHRKQTQCCSTVLLAWAHEASTAAARRATLRYVVERWRHHRLEHGFHTWTYHCEQERDQDERAVRALEALTRATCEAELQATREALAAAQATQAAQSTAFQAASAKAEATRVEEAARQADRSLRLAEAHLRLWDRRRAAHLFHAWKALADRRRHLTVLSKHCQAKRVRGAVGRWRSYRRKPLPAVRFSDTLRRMRVRQQLRLARRVFHAWGMWAHILAVRRRKFVRLTGRRDIQATRRHWTIWTARVARRRVITNQGPTAMSALASMVARRVTQAAWQKWQHVVLGLVRRETKLRTVVDEVLMRTLAQTQCYWWQRWRQFTTKGKRRRAWLATRTTQRAADERATVRRVWQGWHDNTVLQIRRRAGLSLVVMRWTERWARRGLWRWANAARWVAVETAHARVVTALDARIDALQSDLAHRIQAHADAVRAMALAQDASDGETKQRMAASDAAWAAAVARLQADVASTEAQCHVRDEAIMTWQHQTTVEQSRALALETALMAWEEHMQYAVRGLGQERHHVAMQAVRACLLLRLICVQEDQCARVTLLTDKLAALEAQAASTEAAMASTQEELLVKMGAKALECLLQRTTVFCFNRWKAFVKGRQTLRAKTGSVLALLQSNAVARTFRRWHQFHGGVQAQKQLTLKWHRLHAHALVRTAFHGWRSVWARQKTLQRTLALLGAATNQRTVAAAWRAWHAMAMGQKAARRLWTRAFHLIEKRAYVVGVATWKAAADAIGAEAKATFKLQALDLASTEIQKKWNAIVCRQVLRWWRENAASNKHDRDLLTRCGRRLRYLAAGQAFESWRENAWRQRRDRRAHTRLVSTIMTHLLTSAWARWRLHRLWSMQREWQYMQEVNQNSQDALATARAMIDKLTGTVAATTSASHALQDTTRSLKRQLRASLCLNFMQTTLRNAFFEWVRVVKARKHTATKVNQTLRRMQRLSHATIFGAWRAFLASRHAKRARLAHLATVHDTWTRRHVWRGWREWLHTQRSMRDKFKWITQMLATSTTRHVWTRWQALRAHQRHACERTIQVAATLETKALRDGWGRWCGYVQAIQTLDEAARRQAHHLLLFLGARQSHRMQVYFDTWRQFRVRRRAKTAQDVLCTRWICRNVWQRWRRHLVVFAHVRRLVSRFATRVSRLRFAAWTRAVTQMHLTATTRLWEQRVADHAREWAGQRRALEESTNAKDGAVRALETRVMDHEATAARLEAALAQAAALHVVTTREMAATLETTERVLERALAKAVARKDVRTAWRAWQEAMARDQAVRVRVTQWGQAREESKLAEWFARWKKCLGPRRRRRKLLLKFEQRRLRGAVGRWRARTISSLQLQASVQVVVAALRRRRERELALAWRVWTVFAVQMALSHTHAVVLERHRRASVDGMHALAATHKTVASHRTKWGLAMVVWRIRCHHMLGLAWGFQKWKFAAVRVAWRAKVQHLVAQMDDAHALLVREQTQVLEAREDIVEPLRRLWQQLSLARSLDQLCAAVAAVPVPHAAGMLYLVDPLKQELWSVMNQQVTTAPAHFGIAGYVVGSGAVFRSTNVAQETRFHPLVDQYVVTPLVGQVPHVTSVVDRIQMVCVPVCSDDGARNQLRVSWNSTPGVVYGLVQMAFLTHRVDVFILCHAAAAAVECLLRDLLKNARDPVAARAPAKLMHLLKQQKHWRKYYVDVEVRLRQAQDKCRGLVDAQAATDAHLEQFLREKHDALEATIDRLRDQVTEKTRALAAQDAAFQETLATQQQTWTAKEEELHQVIWTLQSQQQIARARHLASAPVESSAAAAPVASDMKTHVLVAEIQGLKNQLVRAESDALFLSKTIRVAMKYQGQLPDVMQTEVRRICRRLKESQSKTTE